MGGADSDYSGCRWCDSIDGHTWDCPKKKEQNMPKELDQVDVKVLRLNATKALGTRDSKIPDECPVCGALAIRVEREVQNIGDHDPKAKAWWRTTQTFACSERATEGGPNNGDANGIHWSRSCRSAWDAALAARKK